MLMDLAQRNASAPPDGLLVRATAHVRQFLCGLHGHDALLHFEETRISLLCASCGHQTPGWDLARCGERSERAAARGPMVRLPLVGERRVA